MIKADRKTSFLWLCNTWRGKLTWTYGTNHRMIFTPEAANSMMIVIRNIVPKDWQLKIVEIPEHTPFKQDAKYYIENMPNV